MKVLWHPFDSGFTRRLLHCSMLAKLITPVSTMSLGTSGNIILSDLYDGFIGQIDKDVKLDVDHPASL